jgi:hypothetical protein
LTRPGAAPLLQRNPLIDAVLVTQHGELPATLRVQSFDVVLCPDAEPETAGLAAAVTPARAAATSWIRAGVSCRWAVVPNTGSGWVCATTSNA